MKLLIEGEQLEKILRVYNSYLKSKPYEGVCDMNIDYNEGGEYFRVIIIFDKQFAIDKGSKFTSFHNRTLSKITEDFKTFTGKEIVFKVEYEKCHSN